MKIDEKILIENQKKTFIKQEKYCFNEYYLQMMSLNSILQKSAKSLSLTDFWLPNTYIGYMKVGFIYIFWFTLSSASSILT